MPDVRGLGLTQARRKLPEGAVVDYRWRVAKGSGAATILEQAPRPGVPVTRAIVLTVRGDATWVPLEKLIAGLGPVKLLKQGNRSVPAYIVPAQDAADGLRLRLPLGAVTLQMQAWIPEGAQDRGSLEISDSSGRVRRRSPLTGTSVQRLSIPVDNTAELLLRAETQQRKPVALGQAGAEVVK